MASIFGIIFVASWFLQLIIWGYIDYLWKTSWASPTVLGISAVSLVLWIVFNLDNIRQWLKKRSTQFAIALIITAVASVVLIGAVNYVSVLSNKKWDVTKNKLHTLSDQTKKVVSELPNKMELIVWTTNLDRMSGNLNIRKFFENFELASKGKLKVTVKNPNDDRAGALRDNVKKDNLIIARAEGGRESRVETFTEAKGEEQVLNAVIMAVKGQKKLVCFSKGHGELDSNNSSEPTGMGLVKAALNDGPYTTREADLSQNESIKDCEVMIIAGPKGDVSEGEVKVLKAYLEEGGKLIGLFGPGTTKGWIEFTKSLGAELNQDIIIDLKGSNQPLYVVTNNYSQDVEVTKNFNINVVLPETSSFKLPTGDTVNGTSIKAFVSTKKGTYAKVGPLKAALQDIRPRPGDREGPLAVGVLLTKPLEAPKADPKVVPPAPKKDDKQTGLLNWLLPQAWAQDDGHDHSADDGHGHGAPAMPGKTEDKKDEIRDAKREMGVILFGNSLFVSNHAATLFGNMDLFLNSVAHLTRDQDLISIRPKDLSSATLNVTEERERAVQATILIVAAAFLVGGVWAKRRRAA
jgi:ABC-type uncharacterized transport system involved in gliding motility auxiliary subunit